MSLRRVKLTALNEHLICGLCSGYFVEATTIIECLHTFCKTCIVRYLASSSFCPICDVQVHKTKPLLSLREDPTLQDVVYKLVPGLFKEEMSRRSEFYQQHPESGGDKTEQSLKERRHFFHVDDQISLSLEYLSQSQAQFRSTKPLQDRIMNSKIDTSNKNDQKCVNGGKDGDVKKTGDADGKKEEDIVKKRFLKCPAAVQIFHLEKFIKMKYSLTPQYKVDIVHNGDCLDSELTLLDVVYMYKWREEEPLRLFYTVLINTNYKRPKKRPRIADKKKPLTKSSDPIQSPPKKIKIECNEKMTNGLEVDNNYDSKHGDNDVQNGLDSSRDDADDAMVIDESQDFEMEDSSDSKSETISTSKNIENPASETEKFKTSFSESITNNVAEFNSVPLFSMPSLPLDIQHTSSSVSLGSTEADNVDKSIFTSSDMSNNQIPLTTSNMASLSRTALTFPTYTTIPMCSSLTSNDPSVSPPPLSTVTSLPPYVPPPNSSIYNTILPKSSGNTDILNSSSSGQTQVVQSNSFSSTTTTTNPMLNSSQSNIKANETQRGQSMSQEPKSIVDGDKSQGYNDVPQNNVSVSQANISSSQQIVPASKPNISTSHPNVSTSQQNISTSQQNVSTSQQNISTSHSNVSTSQQNISTPHSNISTPLSNVSTSLQNVSTSHQNVPASVQSISSPLQMTPTSQQNISTSKMVPTSQIISSSQNRITSQEMPIYTQSLQTKNSGMNSLTQVMQPVSSQNMQVIPSNINSVPQSIQQVSQSMHSVTNVTGHMGQLQQTYYYTPISSENTNTSSKTNDKPMSPLITAANFQSIVPRSPHPHQVIQAPITANLIPSSMGQIPNFVPGNSSQVLPSNNMHTILPQTIQSSTNVNSAVVSAISHMQNSMQVPTTKMPNIPMTVQPNISTSTVVPQTQIKFNGHKLPNIPPGIIPTKPRLGRPPNHSKILSIRSRTPLPVNAARGGRPLGVQGIAGFRSPINANIRQKSIGNIHNNPNPGIMQQRPVLPKQNIDTKPKINSPQMPSHNSASNATTLQNDVPSVGKTLGESEINCGSIPKSQNQQSAGKSIQNQEHHTTNNLTPSSSTIQALKNKVTKSIQPNGSSSPMHSSIGSPISSIPPKLTNGGYQFPPRSPAGAGSSGFHSMPQIFPSLPTKARMSMSSSLLKTPATVPNPIKSPKQSTQKPLSATTTSQPKVNKSIAKSPSRPKASSTSILSIAQSLTNKQLQQKQASVSTIAPETPTINSLVGNVGGVSPNPGLIPPLAGLGIPNALTAYMTYMQAACLREMVMNQQQNAQTNNVTNSSAPTPMDLSPTNKVSPASPLNSQKTKVSTSALTPKSSDSPKKSPTSLPSPKPAQSPTPASPAAPTMPSTLTPEVTITKLPNASASTAPSTNPNVAISISRSSSNSVSINKSNNSSTNTVSITKRPSGTSSASAVSINKYAVARSPSNASIRQIPNPSFLSHQSDARNNTSSKNSQVKKSPIKSSLKASNNNNITNKNSNALLSKSKLSQITAIPKVSPNNEKNPKGGENSPIKETGPLPDTSSISRIEHLTKSLPPASNSPIANGFRYFENR